MNIELFSSVPLSLAFESALALAVYFQLLLSVFCVVVVVVVAIQIIIFELIVNGFRVWGIVSASIANHWKIRKETQLKTRRGYHNGKLEVELFENGTSMSNSLTNNFNGFLWTRVQLASIASSTSISIKNYPAQFSNAESLSASALKILRFCSSFCKPQFRLSTMSFLHFSLIYCRSSY